MATASGNKRVEPLMREQTLASLIKKIIGSLPLLLRRSIHCSQQFVGYANIFYSAHCLLHCRARAVLALTVHHRESNGLTSLPRE